jgi:hypothetical protein
MFPGRQSSSSSSRAAYPSQLSQGSAGAAPGYDNDAHPHVIWGDVESLSNPHKSQSSSSRSHDSDEVDMAIMTSEPSMTRPEKIHRRKRPISDDIVFKSCTATSEENLSRINDEKWDLAGQSLSSSSSAEDFRDEETLLSMVPYDENGVQMSIGSIGHDRGECSQPCAFTHRHRGCAKGARCEFCHFSMHTVVRLQPCKSRRLRFIKQKQRLLEELERDPDAFDLSNYELPPSISGCERTYRKLKLTLENHRDTIRVLREVATWEQAVRGQDPCARATESLKRLSL